jgi:uncharacterized protein (DUF433 family)
VETGCRGRTGRSRRSRVIDEFTFVCTRRHDAFGFRSSIVTTPTTYEHIQTDPSRCGGQAHMAGTRVRVIDIVALYEQSISPEEILDSHEHLSLGQFHAALAYFFDHPEAVEEDFRRSAPDEAEFRRKHPDASG